VQLTRLRVFNYRNFKEEEIQLPPGISLFQGRNGQGKTNLLEAVYLLGYGKSFRTSIPKECIRHGETECRVEGEVQTGSLSRELQVSISLFGKKLWVHGKEVAIDEFVGSLHVLAFTSEHLNIVRGMPADRRAFLDRAMVTLHPSHVKHLASYGRALKQRNRALAVARERKSGLDEGFLASWEELLVQEGTHIAANRQRYVERMKEELPVGLFGSENLKIKYVSKIAPELSETNDIAGRFREQLEEGRSLDKSMGFTCVGPHRDELKLFVNGKALADFGSAGQQRSALIALYFAQMEIHRKAHGFYPLFLVDDVEAELDDNRLTTFLSYLAQRTQTLLTTAKESLVPLMPGDLCRFEVDTGTIRSVQNPAR
jgi:DNA replication and repair protein RecF